MVLLAVAAQLVRNDADVAHPASRRRQWPYQPAQAKEPSNP
jgi:hypothetical protein